MLSSEEFFVSKKSSHFLKLVIDFYIAKRATKLLFEIEPENPATYITLGNIYATAGLVGEVAEVRKVMDGRGVVMKPGLS